VNNHRVRLSEFPPLALITFYAILVFVEVASIVQAIRQHSWAPMYTTGWLPVVVLASLSPAGARRCGLRLGRRAQP
jgi:hypothetical protein